MKWYNIEKTRMIDINCVNSFTYKHPTSNDIEELEVNVNGNVEMLYGDEATQVFKLLTEFPSVFPSVTAKVGKKTKKILLNG